LRQDRAPWRQRRAHSDAYRARAADDASVRAPGLVVGRSPGQRTRCRPLALCAASVAVAFVVAGPAAAERSRQTRPATAASARLAIRLSTVGGMASPTHATVTLPQASAMSTLTVHVRAEGRRPCATSALRLSRTTSSAAAGTSYTWYTLTNVGAAACSMIGYPRVAILNARGHVVQHPAAWSPHPGTMPPERVRLIVLAAGQQARFVLANTDVTPSPGCRAPYTGKTLEVFPPHQTAAIRKPFRGSFCNLVVGPVLPTRHTVTHRAGTPQSSQRLLVETSVSGRAAARS
jgi:hypothetical protein